MKKKMRLKPYVLPTMYLIMVTMLMLLTTANYDMKDEEDITYVSSAILSNTTPVISTPKEDTIIKPIASSNVKVEKRYYDYKGETQQQESSLIYYEDTYIQNSGIDYVSEEKFQIVSILSGTVEKITENELLGKSIQIRHENNLISIYQSLGEINVEENDTVQKGTVIATSGSSKITANHQNSLHFELFNNGEIVNPEKYFGKSLKEINK